MSGTMRRLARLAVGCLPLLGACSPDAGPPAAGSATRIVDLTHAFGEDTIYWPTDTRGFQLEVLASGPTADGWFYSANAFCTAEHGGTHIDAPIHFAEDGHAVADVPLTDLVGPGVVIDVADKAAADSDYRLQRADVDAHEARHGRIPDGAIVLLRTGWSERWPDAAAYLGDDTPGDASNLTFPSYGADAARLLIEERGVRVIGVDTASTDHGRSTDFPVHRIAAGRQVAGLENLTNLGELPATGFTVVALPMKIARGSGGPVRVIAMVDAQ
ncbi:MAG: cyclase family protein [Woeseiaceae bacterium]|nr:cyclase family protein [Woeseiaceae bacterium]